MKPVRRANRLVLFGGPIASDDRGEIRLTQAQLAFLAIVFGEGGLSRLRLGAILWREGDETTIRHRIRQLLHLTNARLGCRGVTVEGDYLLPATSLVCDLTEVRSLISGGSLREAALASRKAFAPRARRWSPEVETWAASLERSIRRHMLHEARKKWIDAVGEGEWRAANDAAECMYAIDPDSEDAVAKVLESQGRLGGRRATEAVYEDFLRRRGGVPPTPHVEAVMDRLRASYAVVNPGADGPFVGRIAALESGRATLERAREGSFAFFLVTGESGIGKTRLLVELQREAVLLDFRCLTACPSEPERRIPLSPILDALQSVDLDQHLTALSEPWRTVVASTLPPGDYPGSAGALPPIQESGIPRRLFDAYSLLFHRIAAHRHTVLFLDDLQWADATTTALLQFLQRRWRGGGFAIIASLRPDLLEAGGPARLYLQRSDGLEAVHQELGDLSDAEAAALVEGIAGDVEDVPIARLCALAGPHPLYLTEVTKDYLAGRLVLAEPPDDEVVIPVSLRQLLRGRLTDLSEEALRVARLLAVSGRTLRLADIATLIRASATQCADWVEELERTRLVTIERDRVRISHELFRGTIYSEISQTRRALLHRSLAKHLMANVGDTDPGELAVHYGRGGEAALAVQHAWMAAEKASESGAMAEAAHFYDLVMDFETDSSRIADATAGLGRALYLGKDLARANPVLELAAARMRATGRVGRALRLEIRRVDGLAAVGQPRVADLLSRLDAIKSEASACLDWEALALCLNAELRLHARKGDAKRIQDVFGELRKLRGRTPIIDTLCQVGLAMQATFAEPEAGLAAARAAVSLTESGGEYRLLALNRLLVVLQQQGMIFLDEAEAAGQEARTLATNSGDLGARFNLEGNSALALLDAGRLDDAEAAMDRADALLATTDLDIPRFGQPYNRAELALARGDLHDAARKFNVAASKIRENTPQYAHHLVAAALGLCALELGKRSEARRLEQALPQTPGPWPYDPAVVITFRARLLERRGQKKAAAESIAVELPDLGRRWVMAWVKLSSELASLYLRAGEPVRAREIACRCHDRCVDLQLPIWRERMEMLMARARRS